MLFLKNKLAKIVSWLGGVKVAVHDGSFHPDDVFAVAILSIYLKKPLEIIRTRDPKVLEKCDYVFDVGREYSPEKKIFDHHQKEFNEQRKNGITYASAGLVWKEFGEKITGSTEVFEKIDQKIIQFVDAEDNGIVVSKNIMEDVAPYTISNYITSLNNNWDEENRDSLEAFKIAVDFAKNILEREIKLAGDSIEAKKIATEIYNNSEDKRVVVFDKPCSWRSTLVEYPEPLFVVKQNSENKNWYVSAVPVKDEQFKNRLDFPESWAGLEGEDLVKITGVSDAVFCHKGRFLVVAKTKEGAITLAKLALEQR